MKPAFYIIASALLISVSCKLVAGTPDFLTKNPEPAKNEVQVTDDEKAKILLYRLHEIRTKDRSCLSVPEKKELRKEARSIKHQFREIYRGSYISAGSFFMAELVLIFLV
jgi:hypothetical protein